jgi:hypothetical protein
MLIVYSLFSLWRVYLAGRLSQSVNNRCTECAIMSPLSKSYDPTAWSGSSRAKNMFTVDQLNPADASFERGGIGIAPSVRHSAAPSRHSHVINALVASRPLADISTVWFKIGTGDGAHIQGDVCCAKIDRCASISQIMATTHGSAGVASAIPASSIVVIDLSRRRQRFPDSNSRIDSDGAFALVAQFQRATSELRFEHRRGPELPPHAPQISLLPLPHLVAGLGFPPFFDGAGVCPACSASYARFCSARAVRKRRRICWVLSAASDLREWLDRVSEDRIGMPVLHMFENCRQPCSAIAYGQQMV